MHSPNNRHRDPQPLTRGWETATVAIGGALLALALAALVGLGVAAWIFGDGWVWPDDTRTAGRVITNLMAGRPGRGFQPSELDRTASATADYWCVAGCEFALLAIVTGAAVLIARYRRPGDARRGMATRAEAAHALGVTRLRQTRFVIRPDLYAQRPRRPHPFAPSTEISAPHRIECDPTNVELDRNHRPWKDTA